MNALFEFLILSGISFILFMFLGYRDAVRKSAPKGMFAAAFNTLSFWKSEDEKGIRGYLFRQNIILKILVSLIGAAILRFIYAYFFDFSSASETFDVFTGITGYFLHALAILLGILLAYQWPKVKGRMISVKDSAIKKNIPEAEPKEDKKIEETKTKKIEPKEETKPLDEKKKDDHNDVIDDYLN